MGLDAGPFWDPDADWVSDEAGSHRLYWTEPGSYPVPIRYRSVPTTRAGASAGRWCTTRATRRDSTRATSRTLSSDGVGADWPIGYEDLKPYYQHIEEELPVAGERWPWGDPHSYPHRPHPVGGNGEIFLRGAPESGITAKVGPVAITNGRFGNRPHCIYRGFCLQGCKVNAKASPLITHIPDALAHGAEIRADCMVTAIEVDERTGRASGVHYIRAGIRGSSGPRRRDRRLLHRNAAAAAELGLPPLPGRPLQRLRPGRPVRHGAGTPQTAGRFDAEVRMYKAPPPR